MSNVVVSFYTDRPKTGKSCVLVKEDGIVKKLKYIPINSEDANIKKELLVALNTGLLFAKNFAKHDGVLLIEVPNQHLCNWLEEKEEKEGYGELLNKVFESLEDIDSTYMFYFKKKNSAYMAIEREYKTTEKEEMSSLDSVFGNLEE